MVTSVAVIYLPWRNVKAQMRRAKCRRVWSGTVRFEQFEFSVHIRIDYQFNFSPGNCAWHNLQLAIIVKGVGTPHPPRPLQFKAPSGGRCLLSADIGSAISMRRCYRSVFSTVECKPDRVMAISTT
jgi:hypothetical protein